MKKTRVVKEFFYSLAGFPVVVENVEVIATGEGTFPLLDYEELDRRILVGLATKETKLTGDQVRFIRHSFELSLRDFAKLFRFTAPSVLKWEQRKNASTSMEWPTELLLRTQVLIKFADKDTALTNWQRLSDMTLPAASSNETLRIPPCPTAWRAETPHQVSFEMVFPESEKNGLPHTAYSMQPVSSSMSYKQDVKATTAGNAGKEIAAHDFAYAA